MTLASYSSYLSLLYRRLALLFAITIAIAVIPSVFAADATLGKLKSEPCAACHGDTGNTPIAGAPKLAGQEEKYLLYAMHAYRSGARNNAIMNAQLAELSDDDLADLAAYYAAQTGDLR